MARDQRILDRGKKVQMRRMGLRGAAIGLPAALAISTQLPIGHLSLPISTGMGYGIGSDIGEKQYDRAARPEEERRSEYMAKANKKKARYDKLVGAFPP